MMKYETNESGGAMAIESDDAQEIRNERKCWDTDEPTIITTEKKEWINFRNDSYEGESEWIKGKNLFDVKTL